MASRKDKDGKDEAGASGSGSGNAHRILENGPLFYLLERGDEWDEVLVLAAMDDQHVLCISTDSTGGNF
eukprot:10975801-Heterocapsa_arctica.AAC.1